MRVLAFGAALAAIALSGTPAAAQGAWCSEDMNSRNCGWYTLQQCQAAISGLNGRCDANLFAPKAQAGPAKPVRRVKHNH